MDSKVLLSLVTRLVYYRIGDLYERRRRSEMTSDDKEEITGSVNELESLLRELKGT